MADTNNTRDIIAPPLAGPTFNVNGADRVPSLESQLDVNRVSSDRRPSPMPETNPPRNPRQGGL